MVAERIDYKITRDIPIKSILTLYRANGWSAARKPDALRKALMNSNALVSAWAGDKLVGLGNSITDGFLVVYYPHLLVLPEYQGKGIGRRMVQILRSAYKGFHQQVLIADGKAIEFYKKCGFKRAGKTEPMWIYRGTDH